MQVGQCPICDAQVTLEESTQVSEIVACAECKNKLEVKGKNGSTFQLSQAPQVEEDWGE